MLGRSASVMPVTFSTSVSMRSVADPCWPTAMRIFEKYSYTRSLGASAPR